MIDLAPHHKQLVLDLLKKYLPQASVYVFGSRSKGNAIPSSDLDLAVVSDDPIELVKIAELKIDLSDSDLPFFVDVVDMHQVDENFHNIIQQDWTLLKTKSVDVPT